MTERHRLGAHKQPKRNMFHLSGRIPILPPRQQSHSTLRIYAEDTLIRSRA